MDATEKATINTLGEREAAVYLFKEAATAYKAWIDLFDPELLEDFKYFQWKNNARSQTAGFIVGIITSTIVTVVAWLYLPPSPQQNNLPPPQQNTLPSEFPKK